MPVTFRQNRITDRLSMKIFSKKGNLWHKMTRRESPKKEKGKSDLSTYVSAPSTLTAQIQIISNPNTSKLCCPAQSCGHWATPGESQRPASPV